MLTAVKPVQDGVGDFVTGGVSTFNAFKLTDPSRLVLDLPGVKSELSSKTIAIDNFGISKARVGTSQTRQELSLMPQKAIPPYQMIKSDNGIKILLSQTASPVASSKPAEASAANR